MMAWIESVAGPEYAPAIFWTILALIALAIVMILVRIVRAFSKSGHFGRGRDVRARVAVLDAAAIDDNRRLVLVRRDEEEHLLLIGGPNDLVVEQRIRQHVFEARRGRPRTEEPSPIADHYQPAAASAPREPDHVVRHDERPVAAPVHAVRPATDPSAVSAQGRPAYDGAAPTQHYQPVSHGPADPHGREPSLDSEMERLLHDNQQKGR